MGDSQTILMAYLAVVLLPLLYRGIPNPIGVRWLVTHGAVPMPPDVLRKAMAASAAIPYIQVIAFGIAVAVMLFWTPVTFSWRGFDSVSWTTTTLVGLVASGAWLAFCAAIVSRFPLSTERLSQHPFNQRSPAYCSLCLQRAQ